MTERVQLRRTKGWRLPPDTVVVSRPSKWGNPHDWRAWRENAPADVLWTAAERNAWCKEHAVDAFEEDLRDGSLKLPLEDLRGKNLACWCRRNERCHADVLLKFANAGTV